MHWQPMKFNLVKSLRKDDALGAVFTADGSWFQMCEIMYAYEPEGIYYYINVHFWLHLA